MLKAVLVGTMLTLSGGLGVAAWISLRPAPPPAPLVAEAPPPAPPARIAVLAAARPVQAGSLLKPEDIGAVELAAAPDGARLDTPAARSELIGAMARHTMLAQQPLLPADILRPTEGGFLAAVLAPNHRAVSVAVDAVSGTAGLIWPGDKVDLILTQTLDDQATPAGRRTFGETVLQDLRVVAVDQLLARGTAPDAAVSPPANRTVTLEVLPEAAEAVAVAVRLGKVALSVRAAEAGQPAAGRITAAPAIALIQSVGFNAAAKRPAPPAPVASPVTTTWGQDVSPGLIQTPQTSNGATVRVFQGAATEKEFKFQ